ncbi:uncharacterized protein KZ484_003588 [Pholidichthys leucotaenia]
MFAGFCLTLLALSTLSAASEPSCEELIKPLKDQSKAHGKWIYYVGASDNEEQLKELKTIHSCWLEISPIPDSDALCLHYADKLNGTCIYGTINATFSGDHIHATFHFNNATMESVGKHLETCPDCLLWSDDHVTTDSGKTRKSKNLYLFTKSGALDASQLEIFKKQAECLNLLSDFHFTNTADLCPKEKEPAAEVKNEEQ